MKKVVFFLVATMVLGLTSCNEDVLTSDDNVYEQGTGKDGTPSGGDKDGGE